MCNPFLKDGYLTPTASINKLKIVGLGNLPYNKLLSDEQIQNQYAVDLISSQIFQKRGITPLGRNLGYLLLALKKGCKENRTDWQEEHWAYWRQIEEIFLAGGITTESLGCELLLHAQALFTELGCTPYKITIPPDSALLSLIGAAKIAAGHETYKGSSLVFDFGQSYVKRGFLQTGPAGFSIKILERKEALHAQLDYEEGQRSKDEAENLDAYIQSVIVKSAHEINTDRKPDPIVLSIANYVHTGAIAGSRGGYGKLCLLADNYEAYLTERLRCALGSPVKIILVHDVTAAATIFNESDQNYAVLSLGTFMGVGFPTPLYNAAPFSYTLT